MSSGTIDGCTIAHNSATGPDGNISEPPMFCDQRNGDYSIDAQSVCAPDNNGCMALMGACGIGCDSPVGRTTWGRLKATYQGPGRADCLPN